MPTANAEAMIRSGLSPANSWSIAASSAPTSASAGSRTSSRNTLNCRSALMMSISILVYSSPAAPVGTTKSTGLRAPVVESSVRATTSTLLATSTPEM